MPLEYMLAVMNDPTADLTRRDRMAIASAPFVHAKIGDEASGKRDKDAAAAKEGASGRYEPPPPPRLVVNG
jgi:phage terminase small subunit